MSDTTFDLWTNTQVPLSVLATDANDALVEEVPMAVFTSSDDTTVTVHDNGDGTAVAVRVKVDAGSAVVSAKVTNADGTEATGTLTITLAAQTVPVPNVVNVEIVPGIPS